MPKFIATDDQSDKKIAQDSDVTNDLDSTTEQDHRHNEHEHVTEPIPPPAPSPRATFRPLTQSDVETRAKKLADKTKIPKPPAKRLSFEAMMEYLSLLTPEMWDSLIIYVFRYYPIIRKREGEDKNINKITEPFDRDYIKRRHGGGEYGFSVNDRSQPQCPQIFTSSLKIPISECDPVLDLSTVVLDHKDNKSYIDMLKDKGILDNNGGIKSEMAQQSNEQTTAITNKILDAFLQSSKEEKQRLTNSRSNDDNELAKLFSSMLVEQMKANSPDKTMTMLTGLMGALKGAQTDSSVDVLKMLMESQNNNTKQMMDLMMNQMKMFQDTMNANLATIKDTVKPNNQNIDPVSNFQKMCETFMMFDKLRGGKSAEAESTWIDKGIDAFERIGVPLVQTIMQAVALKNSGMKPEDIANMQQAQQLHRQLPAPTNEVDNNTNNINNTDGQQQGQSSQSQSQSQQSTMQQTPTTQLQTLIRQFGGMLENAISQGRTGEEFAFSVEGMIGSVPLGQILALGENNIIMAMRSVPEFWGKVAPTPERETFMQTWVKDFVNYQNSDNEDDETEVIQ